MASEPATTPSQTIGPFFHGGLQWLGADPDPEWTATSVAVSVRLFDGAGAPVTDGLVETWQADAAGRFPSSSFGRCPADERGTSTFRTVKPAALPAGGGVVEAPHLDLSIFCRGLLNRLVTRLYFDDEAAANAVDPVLLSLGDEGERLVARSGEHGYHLDVHLQGPLETPFFRL